MKKSALFFSLLLLSRTAFAQESLSFGINVIKPILGLPNIDFEFGFDRKLSMSVFTEYFLYRTPLSLPSGFHPDWVMRIGPRYYLYSFQEDITSTGFYLSSSLGFNVFTDSSNRDPISVALEAGYKHVVFDHFYLQPRAIVTQSLVQLRTTPGVELIMGYRF
jgi:hypothetical protein